MADRERLVDLAGEAPYTFDTLDPWGMTETSAGTLPPGIHLIPPQPHGRILRFAAAPTG